MKTKAIVIITLLAASRISHAQQDTAKAVELKPVTVTATRSEKNPMEVGRSITVLSNEQIKSSGANTIAELLSQQEGIYIVGTGQNHGQLQSVFTRGANNNQTNILIDGVKISDPSSTDNAIDLSEMSLSNIERIEIVRGSHSTLYGSSAIGGVVNIITKKNQTPGVHADAEIKGGTFGEATSLLEQNVGLNYTHTSGFYVNAGIYNTSINGLDATVDTVTNPNAYTHNHRDKDDFSKTDLLGKLGYKNKKWDIFASYKTITQKSEIDDGAFSDDDNYTINFKRNLITYGASYKLNDKLNFSYIGGMTDLNKNLIDDSTVVANDGTTDHSYWEGTYKGNTMTNELLMNYKMKGLNVVAGGGLFNEQMTFQTYYYSTAWGIYESKSNLDSLNINVNTANEFLHLDLDGSLFGDNWSKFGLGLGARNTKHDLFGSNLTYEINPSLKVSEGGLLFVSYSTGFNAPSLYQLYSPDKDFTSAITRGNKTLKPETSASWEFGFKQNVNENITYSISYFKTIVENSIDYVYLWDKSKKIDSLGYGDYRGDTYVNIGKQTNQGVEIAINSKVSDKLLITGNFSLISGKLQYNPTHIDTSHTHGNYVQLFASGAFVYKEVETIGLIRRPSTANVGFIYKPIEKISLGANIKYVGARNDIYYSTSSGPFGALATQGVADYAVSDIIIRYTIIKNLSATLRLENIFDVKYYEIYGYTTRGRGAYLNLRYAF